MSKPHDHKMRLFRQDYQVARSAFLEAARASGARLSSVIQPSTGARGENLATDVAAYGVQQAANVIFLTSGVHGVELTAGTASQVDLMLSGSLGDLPSDTSVVMIHAANPWGASFGRRYTEENVDLCRNFVAFPCPRHAPAGYDAIRAAVDVAPDDGKAVREADNVLSAFAAEKGVPALYGAVMAGQYREAAGIGFGGHGPTWARQTLETTMRFHAAAARRVVAIDYHTGVGPYAYGCVVAMQTGQRLIHAKKWFGDWIMAPRANPPPGFIDVTGHSGDGYEALFPEADVIAGVLEIGTLPQSVFLQRLIAEHRWTRHRGPASDEPGHVAARQALLDFFVPDDLHWQGYALHRGRQIFQQALEGLGHGSR